MRYYLVVLLIVGVTVASFVAKRSMRRTGPPTPPPVTAEPVRDHVADLRGFIANAVKAGYEDRKHIIESAAELYRDDLPGQDLDLMAARMADQELAAQEKREQGWKTPTDCDRLDRAFAALDKSGIVARQNFSDCGTCGAAEIADEMEAARKAGKRVRGYTFFHEQDAEGAVDGSLYLSYGALAEAEAAQLAIAREVVAALKHAGLDADWNGRYETRILLKLDWKKRRFTKPPPG
jgi:hypothetical protein